MDLAVAATRLNDELSTLHELLLSSAANVDDDRDGANAPGDMSDSEESLTSREQDDAVAQGLRHRLAQVRRALDRLADGTYGRSVRSGDVIHDERLDADPAAELTAAEAAQAQ